jgi:hypothetical protein
VGFRADAARARIILEVAGATGCGLALNDEDGLVEVWADSITAMLAFARKMPARRPTFDALPVPAAAIQAMADLDEDPSMWEDEDQ